VLFDAIGLFLALVFIALGAYRGTLAGFLRVATVVAAYLSAFLLATHFSKLLALLTGMSRLGSAVLIGSGVFFAVYVVGAVISALLIRSERERRSEAPRGTYDRLGGAFFGLVQAGVALLLLAVMGSVLDAAYRAGLPQGMDQSHSFLVGSTRQIVAAGVGRALGDSPGSKLAQSLISDPGHALSSAQQLLSGPRFAALQSDHLFWELVGDGQIDRAMTRDSFAALLRDDATRGGLADLGVVPEEARSDPQAFRASMRQTLETVAPRIRAIRDDPEIAQIAADPEVQSAIEAGNSTTLLAKPQVRALIDRLVRDFERDPTTIP